MGTAITERLGRVTGDRRWQAGAALTLILVVATLVRVVGVRFGLPLLVHPDEWAVVDGVINMARRNSFEPPWSLRPDHVEMKVDYFAFAAYAHAFRGTSIEKAFAADPAPFYMVARLVTAAFGIATVVLAYLIGRRSSRAAGFVAAALFALFPAYVRHAHYATPDVPLTFAIMLMIYALMRYVAAPAWLWLMVASFAVALAIAIKYPGAVGAVMIAIVVVFAAVRDRSWVRLVVHGAGAAAGVVGFLFLISPVLFTDFAGVRAELKVQAAGDRLGHSDLGLIGNLHYYATTYAQTGGIVLASLGVLGLVIVVRRRQFEALPWLIGVLMWISLSSLPMQWERWGTPMWVTPLLLASVGLAELFRRFRSSRLRWVGPAVAAVVLAQLGAADLAIDAGLAAPDTRAAALKYTHAHHIRHKDAMYEGYTPFLPGAPALFFDQVRKDGDGYVLLTKKGAPASYVIVSSNMYQRVLGDPEYTDQAAAYQWIFEHCDEVGEFGSTAAPQPAALEPVAIARNLQYLKDMADGGRSGPIIKIYAVPASTVQETARVLHR